jgi:gliding motility-associated transport system permease protein
MADSKPRRASTATRRRTPAAARPAPAPAAARPDPPPLREQTATTYDAVWRTGLLNVAAITGRELAAYFVSPIGYVVTIALIVLVSAFGYLIPLYLQSPVAPNQAFYWMNYLMMFLAPLYTMRLLADERRTGTLEVLLTSPVRDWEAVVAKWLAAWLVFALTTLFTLVYVLLIAHYSPTQSELRLFGASFQVGTVDYGGYVAVWLGALLSGAAFMAIGLLASSLTSNQIIAAVIGIAILVFVYYVLPSIGDFSPGGLGDFIHYLGGSARFEGFYQGQVALKDVVYFLTLTVGALFLTTRVLESRRWR